MKRILTLMTILALVITMFAGCSKDQDKSDKTVVGFIYVGPVGDGGWTHAHDAGRAYLVDNLDVKTIVKESVKEDASVEKEIRNMIDQGASIIFATSFGYMEHVEILANEFPEVTFFHCSGYTQTDNMASYFGRMYEARYLSGIVAGMKTETNKIGYVAAKNISEVIRGINAFTLGAQSVNPDVEVEVVWTDTWFDPAKEKEAAVALLDGGADIITQHQDTVGPQQAAEEAGVYSIGYNTDMTQAVPGAHMTAPVWHWGPYYVEQVQNVLNGSFQKHAYWGGLETGTVGLSPLTDLAPEGAQEAIDAVKAQIINGELNIFSGTIYDQEGQVIVEEGQTLTDQEMLTMEWFVKGVIGKAK